MDKKLEEKQIRKTNLRIFPTYKKLAWDYLFFYAVDFLFLTQIKRISPAEVVLKSSFFALFSIALQIPSNITVDFLGRKNSVVLANTMNCIYILMLILSRSFADLIFAELISAIGFSIKNVAEPSLLNASIAPSRYKSKIFSKINIKGMSGHYRLSAISKIIAGYLFTINGYLPMICALIVLITVTIISLFFIEPLNNSNKENRHYKKSIKDVSEGFAYILKAERLKALILCSALINSLLVILQNCNTSLLEDIKVGAFAIGLVSAIGSMFASYSSTKQNWFHNKFRNRSLLVVSIALSTSCVLAGLFGAYSEKNIFLLGITILAICFYYALHGIYFSIIDKYLRNFTNKNIDTKIFAANNLAANSMKFICGLMASFLLDKMKTAYCLITIGILYKIVFVLVGNYMKTRVGKNPSEYSKEELKYDELH